jgi:cytochrome c
MNILESYLQYLCEQQRDPDEIEQRGIETIHHLSQNKRNTKKVFSESKN